MIRILKLALAAGVLATLPLPAAPESLLENFRYVRSAVRAPGESGRAWYAIDFDSSLYEAIDNLNTDLRLIDIDRQVVPFTVERLIQTSQAQKEELLPGKFTGVQTLADGRSAVEFELEAATGGISSIELVTPEKDFEKTVSVAVGDGGNWATAVPEYRFLDYSKQLELTSRKLNFPRPLSGRIIRLIFGATGATPPETPLKIDALRVYRTTSYDLPGAPQLFPAQLTEISRSHDNGKTVVIFRSDRAPLTQIKITVATPLYQRRVTWAGSDNQRIWVPISGGTIRRIDSDTTSTVELPESRYKFYALEIQNGNDPPLENIQLSALSAGYRIIIPGRFAAEALWLYYGGKAPRPDYDLKTHFEHLGDEQPGRYTLGKVENNPFRPGRSAVASSYRWVLSAMLLIGAGFLLYGILRRLRHIDATLPAD